MTAPVIIDVAALVILAGFTRWGVKKGLIRALTGLVVVSISLFGAGFAASALAEPAAKTIAPIIEKQVEARVEAAIQEQLSGRVSSAQLPVNELLGLLGLDDSMKAAIGQQAQATIRETGASALTAVVENTAQSILYRILYALSFAVISGVLHTSVRCLKLVFRLPGLRGLNKVGGGVLGFLEGSIILFLAAWVLRLLGASFAADSYAVQIFTSHLSLDSLTALLPIAGLPLPAGK